MRTSNRTSGRRAPNQLTPIALALQAGLLSLSVTGMAMAQDTAPAESAKDPAQAVLPVVSVRASSDVETATGPVRGYVAQRSATATKIDAPLIETPRAVSVVTRDQIEAQAPRNLLEVLGYTAGVYTTNLPSSLDSSLVWLRGMRSSLADTYYRDGMRNASGSSYNYRSPEPYGLERVEVLRGPASVMFGQNAPGGVVNLVSKRPTATPQHEVAVQVGSFQRKQIAADVGGPLDDAGAWSYRVVGLTRTADSQVDFAEDNRDYLSTALTWRPTQRTSITFLGDYQRNDGLTYVLLPAEGTALPNPNGKIPVNRALSANNNEEFKTGTAGYLLEHAFDDTWSVRQNVRYTKHASERFVANWPYFTGADLRVVEPWVFLGTAQGRQWTFDNQVQAKFSTGAVTQTVVAGVDYLRAKASVGSGGYATTLDIYDPVYPDLARPTISERVATSHQQLGVYVQDQLKFNDRWVVSLGGRKDWAKLHEDTTDVQAGTTTPNTQKDNAFTGQAGVLYLLDNGLAPYASYATSFTPVGGTDFDGTPFKPEKGKQFEVGLKYQPKDGKGFVAVSVFDLRKQNVTTADPAHPDERIQTGEVRSLGIELEGKAELMRGLNLIANLTHVKPEVIASNDGDLGKQPPAVARDTASVWVDYTVLGLTLGGGVRYTGSAYGDALNTFKAPSYALVDVALRYDLGRAFQLLNGTQLALNVGNVSDKVYVGNCEYTCTYGARRNATLTLRHRW